MIQRLNPADPFGLLITLCWVVFLVVWAVSALFVKRTIERSMGWARLLALAAVVLIYEVVRRAPGVSRELWPRTVAGGVTAVLLTVLGLAIALWARAVLGRNWSGSITFKEN